MLFGLLAGNMACCILPGFIGKWESKEVAGREEKRNGGEEKTWRLNRMVGITRRDKRNGVVVERQDVRTQSQILKEQGKCKMRYFLILRDVLPPTQPLLYAAPFTSV